MDSGRKRLIRDVVGGSRTCDTGITMQAGRSGPLEYTAISMSVERILGKTSNCPSTACCERGGNSDARLGFVGIIYRRFKMSD